MNRRALFGLILSFPLVTPWVGRGDGAEPKLDGIVLVISDGTSLELLTAARDFARGADGRLAFDEFPRTAFVRTYSGSDYVTDSSAAATAMARGIKAHNRVVGVADAFAKATSASILDLAKAAGWSTAIITDDSVTGGTPAPFLVEHDNRDEDSVIAAKIIEQLGGRVDIVLGGGSKYFFDQGKDPTVTYEVGEQAAAQKNQTRLAELPIKTFDDWESYRSDQGAESRPILGVFHPGQFPFFADGARTPRLKDMVEKTVTLLRQRKRPFFLMVEAGLPDVACHFNQARRAIGEVLEFDATIAWLRKNLGPRTLLLATTDHNNGGFTINGPPLPLRLRGDDLLGENPVTGSSYFTWASGPGANRQLATTRTKTVFEAGQPARSITEPVQMTDGDYRQPALIGTKASLHSGGDVWLVADGPGSERVRGSLNNTDIFRIMAEAIGSPAR